MNLSRIIQYPSHTEEMEYSFWEDYEEPPATAVALTFISYILYAFAILFGIPCNIFVLVRMCALSRKRADVYSNGAGVCLFVMALADIVSLSSILVHYALSIQTRIYSFTDANEGFQHTVCKIVIFSMHVSTSVSIWSWLLMSALRYLSVHHPLLHIRLWQVPTKVLVGVLFISALVNGSLLISVQSDIRRSTCTLTPLFGEEFYNRVLLFIEIVWSFIVPSASIIFMDSSVYLCRLRLRRTSDLSVSEIDFRRNYSPRDNKRNSGYLWRWMVIALIDIVLNAPENLFRLSQILGYTPQTDGQYIMCRTFAQVLYYLQFAFNGLYLALFIYDKSTRPITKCRFVENSATNRYDSVPLRDINERTRSG